MTLHLVMIVKNEAGHIVQTIDSVGRLVDGVSILDTGSTDGTQDLIREACKANDIRRVKIHEEPIRTYLDTGIIDFAETRNRGLELAETDIPQSESSWMLLLNGDDVVEANHDAVHSLLRMAALHEEAFFFRVGGYSGGSFSSTRLVRAHRGWRYDLPTHEVIWGRVAPAAHAPGRIVQLGGGDRVSRWKQDKIVLTRYLEANPGHHRALFYLAQTEALLGNHAMAAELYERRTKLGGWEEEVYEAFYRRAQQLEHMQGDPDAGVSWGEVQQAYLEAFSSRPSRAEPLFKVASHWLGKCNKLCYAFARLGADLPKSTDTAPSVEDAVYDWQMLDLVGTSGFYAGSKEEGAAACERAMKKCPVDQQLRIHRNYSFYTRSARELFGSFESVEMLVPLPEPYVGVNPSIWIGEVNGKLRRFCVLRGVNFEPTPDGNNYIVRDADQIVRTRNYWMELDENYELVDDAREIHDLSGRRISHFPVHGYEDMRLFRWRGGFWATATVCDAGDRGDSRATGQRCEIGLLQLNPESVTSCELLRGPWSEHFQKNWRPLADADADGGQLRFVYSSIPFSLLAYVDNKVVPLNGEVPAPPPAHGLRGSSQVLYVQARGRGPGFLWVDHEVSFDAKGGGRMYQERFVFAADSLDRVTHVSPPFHLHKEVGIEFVCGLALDGERLVLSYGERDLHAKLGFIDLDEVLRTLDPA